MAKKINFAERFGGAALITGASSGIGEAFARALAARGMDLVLVARRADRLQGLAAELETRHRVRAVALPQDLLAADADERLREATAEANLPIGLLVNNAGFGSYGPFLEQSARSQATMVDLNCRVPVALTHAFLPAMLERGKGGVIMVASVAGFQPVPLMATYGATKAFDLMFAEALWAELRPRGIDVLALCPGVVRTGFQEVAGADDMPSGGAELTAAEVVEVALGALGRKLSVVPGVRNKLLANTVRLAPRRVVAALAMRMMGPKQRS